MKQPPRPPQRLLELMAEAMAGKEYTDRLRWCRLTDAKAALDYEAKVAGGCCGFHDAVVVIDGEVWLFGFNYGH